MIYICEADLKEGELRGQKIEGQWILVLKHKGTYYGLDAACAHSGFPLYDGSLSSDGVLTCSYHYAKFDCRSGSVVSKPRICDDQIVFSVKVEKGKVYWIKNP